MPRRPVRPVETRSARGSAEAFSARNLPSTGNPLLEGSRLMRLPFMLALLAMPLPHAARAAEPHVDVAAFAEVARRHVGERVTLDHCHLVFATPEEMTCVGLASNAATGDVRAVGKLLIRVAAAEMRSRNRALALCDGGDLGEACEVSVSGEVFDASRSFGLGEAWVMGLREATICWPD